MTTGIILGTGSELELVCKSAYACGFAEMQDSTLHHKTIPSLRLQIKSFPSYFSGMKNIITEIEFDDLSNMFPENPDAIKVLDELYSKLPDLIYRKRFLLTNKQTPINPVSEFLEKNIKK